ncbi:hypothetical protein Fcan01_24194 [Folsomia candida]|uniref:Uncharacterized protein n=1 Tax=Folsomia candida TaxID=158441 RepID=A0A226D5Q6_FOLCA|nr:hypothetical protein Fcan01_24194 [Folsomia candida]
MVSPCCCINLQSAVKFMAFVSMALNGIMCLMSGAGLMTFVIIEHQAHDKYTAMELVLKEPVVVNFSDILLKRVIRQYGILPWISFFIILTIELALHFFAGAVLMRAGKQKSVNLCVFWMLYNLTLFIWEITAWLIMFAFQCPNLMFLYEPKTLIPFLLGNLYEFWVVEAFIKHVERERRAARQNQNDIVMVEMGDTIRSPGN